MTFSIKELEIEKSVFNDDVYYIKAPIDGEVKDIKVKEDDEDTDDVDEASDIADIIEKYGYLALISSDDLMYIVTEDSAEFLKIGAEVKVSRYDYEYDGIVEKVEDGKTYILIHNDNVAIGGRVNIYSEESNEKIKGTAQLYDWVEVGIPVEEGEVSQVYVYNNRTVEQGERLFKITARSQDMIDLYSELEDLKEDLSEKQQMLENLQITSPVDGIITQVSIAEGDEVADGARSYTIADTSVWVVKVDVDELDISQIELGMNAQVTVDAYDGSIFEGRVSEISSVGTASNGITSYEVYIEVENNDVFKLNMSANAEIEADFIFGAMTVPVEAVREVNGKYFAVVYTNPTQEELDAAKNKMIEAENSALVVGTKSTGMSQEEIAAKKKEAIAQKETAQKSQDKQTNEAGLAALKLSIADMLYGEPIEVEVGLINETYAQILSGLNDDDEVILPDTSSESASGYAQSFPGMGKAFN